MESGEISGSLAEATSNSRDYTAHSGSQAGQHVEQDNILPSSTHNAQDPNPSRDVSAAAIKTTVRDQPSQRPRIVPTGSKINFKLSATGQNAAHKIPPAVSNDKAAANPQHDKMAELAKSCLQAPSQPLLNTRHKSQHIEQDRARRPSNSQPDTPVTHPRRPDEVSQGTPDDRSGEPFKRSRLSRSSLSTSNPSQRPASRDSTQPKEGRSGLDLFESLPEPLRADKPNSGRMSGRAPPEPSWTPQNQDVVLPLAPQPEALPKQPQGTASISTQKSQKKKGVTAREYLERQKAVIAQLSELRQQSAQKMAALQEELDRQKASDASAQQKLVCLWATLASCLTCLSFKKHCEGIYSKSSCLLHQRACLAGLCMWYIEASQITILL